MDELDYYAYLASRVPPAALARAAAKKLARRAARALGHHAPAGDREILAAFCAEDGRDLALKLAAPRASAMWADASRREEAAGIAGRVPGLLGRILARADRAWARDVSVFGTRVAFGRGPESVDWHLDGLSGQRFDPTVDARSPAFFLPGMDPKAAWAVSRFDQALALGQGCWLSPSEEDRARFAHEFSVLVRHFEAANPAGRGVNWASPMEVALRAANLCLAFLMMRHRPELQDPAFALSLARSLAAHGRHVERQLEDTAPVPNNHLVANLVGLLHLGVVFPELPRARAWRDHAVEGLRREIARQVLDDGFTFEGSTGYHRLATELFTLALLAARAGRLELGQDFLGRLHAMYRAVRTYLTPAGFAPQLGDNDSGRALPLADRPSLDHAYLLPLGAALFEDPELKPEGAPCCDELVFLLGAPGLRVWDQLPESGPRQSASLPRAGLFFLRAGPAFCAISCGTNGQVGVGGHSHNDKLAVEIHAGERPVIVDPGSPCYGSDPERRDLFRSTAAHSTVRVDRAEQNRIPEARPFALPDHARARVLAFESSPGALRFAGEHRGYERLASPVRHQREVVFVREARAFLITDRLQGSGTHRAEVFWQLPDRWARPRFPRPDEIQRLAAISGAPGPESPALEVGPEARPAALLVFATRSPPRLSPSLYSPGYGQTRDATRVEVSLVARLPLELVTAVLLL